MTNLIRFQRIILYIFLFYFVTVALLYVFGVSLSDKLALIGIVSLLVATSAKLLFVAGQFRGLKLAKFERLSYFLILLLAIIILIKYWWL